MSSPIAFITFAPGCLCRLDGIGTVTADAKGWANFNAPDGWGASHLFVTAQGYQPYSQHVDLTLIGSVGHHDYFLSANPEPELGFPKREHGVSYQSIMSPLVPVALSWL